MSLRGIARDSPLSRQRLLLLSVMCLAAITEASNGDEFKEVQPLFERWLDWTCSEECVYKCSRETTRRLVERNDPKYLPFQRKYFGKWPFRRIFGVQEPASTIFSALHAIGHLYMIKKFRDYVPKTAPLYYVYHGTAIVGTNTWIWSTAFHARDRQWTEKLDYSGALALVLWLFHASILRFTINTKRKWFRWLSFVCLISFYLHHVHYMLFVKFDYDHNMSVNISAGLLYSCAWLIWCASHHRRLNYAWKVFIVVAYTNIFLLLEVFDFPPVWGIFDAHAIWHGATVPMTFLWYSFGIDDCLYLNGQMKKKKQADAVPDQAITTAGYPIYRHGYKRRQLIPHARNTQSQYEYNFQSLRSSDENSANKLPTVGTFLLAKDGSYCNLPQA